MPICAECVFAAEPSPTIIKCRIHGVFHYLDDRACDDFTLYEEEDGREKESERRID